MLLSFSEIQKKINGLGMGVGIPESDLHIFSSSPGDGRPHISYDNGLYNYIYAERGVEFFRKTTSSKDELFYWIMSDFIYKVAFQYELENRVENSDGRRIAFNKALDLMGSICDEWRLKAQHEIDDILTRNPYTDF
ncbi:MULTISPECIES: Imm63 family immunity protein [Serratia]|nr:MULTISPECIES: Imm63 family immunity protein [Serratia]MBX9286308.1 immunity 63 family protein [Serratia marcescens]MBX9301310.1 immunity 63 family protein [Serratia marcescens]MBX9306141.1 immunity 63 family protein [Serratia marcescens]MBX9311013.1 immunity 63 family protein [Serratia marcescens]MBX9315968.1 immunity 63 family protein [Serratia marcescens]